MRSTPPWHIVTGEFPPAPGGVSDYTLAISAGLAAAGDEVHVWCPAAPGAAPEPQGVHVHQLAGPWRRVDLDAADAALDALPGPRRLLVQWVPHAYGNRSLNIGFCRWIHRRSRAGDIVDLMVHEPFLAFGEGRLRHNAAAAIHRLMVALLLHGARRVWVAVPAWSERLRPWAIGRRLECCWLPVPSNVPVVDDAAGVTAARATLLGRETLLIGVFSTYGRQVREDLRVVVPQLLEAAPSARVLLLGRSSHEFAAELQTHLRPSAVERLTATGGLDAFSLSRHLQVCDLMVQAYADGASTRRGTLMAALAHGLPVVTTVGRLSEDFWATSDAVIAVPPQQRGRIVESALTLAGDPERRRTQGRLARELYESRFDVSHTLRALREDACVAV